METNPTRLETRMSRDGKKKHRTPKHICYSTFHIVFLAKRNDKTSFFV